MKEPAIVVVTDIEQLEELRSILAAELYRIIGDESGTNLQVRISECASSIVILDLDHVPVDDRFLRNLKNANPRLSILVISSKRCHPELRESMRSTIHACLNKPLDSEEVKFWLKSITLDRPRKNAGS
jgi:DNA-binding NtrC family response regulator